MGKGRYPNHVWLADITRVPLVVPFLHIHLAVVSYFEPSAHTMVDLVQAAIRQHGTPSHFGSDHGAQFSGYSFLQARSARHTTAIRSPLAPRARSSDSGRLKLHLGLEDPLLRPWNIADFERRLVPALIRYRKPAALSASLRKPWARRRGEQISVRRA